MKKYLSFLLIAILSLSICFAQDEEEKKSDPKKNESQNLFIGGSLSVGYQNGFLIGINPYFGKKFLSWADAGVIVNYQHYSETDYYDNKFRSNTIGAGVFGRIYPVDVIFLQVQPEYNSTTQKYIQPNYPTAKATFSAPSLLLGAGYKSSRGEKNAFTWFAIMIDVLKDLESPYIDSRGNMIPVIRAGINIPIGK